MTDFSSEITFSTAQRPHRFCSMSSVYAMPEVNEGGAEEGVVQNIQEEQTDGTLSGEAENRPEQIEQESTEEQAEISNNLEQDNGEESQGANESAEDMVEEPEAGETLSFDLPQADQEQRDENGLPLGYNQDIMDVLNNQPAILEESAEIESSVEDEQTQGSDLPEDAIVTLSEDTIKDEYKAEIVGAPFNVQNSVNESVSLASGALTLGRTILSLPEKMGRI